MFILLVFLVYCSYKAHWGTSEDIKPYIDPDFSKNILLTQTEPVSYTHLDVYKRQGETWKATVSLTAAEQTIEITLDVPVEWAQEKPGSSVFQEDVYKRQVLLRLVLFPFDFGQSRLPLLDKS